MLLLGNIGWIIIALLNRNVATFLVSEDKPVQIFQFLFLVFTAFYCFKIVQRSNNVDKGKIVRYSFISFAILTLFIAFEEISWGQRIFNIATPDFISNVNVQNEITLHNHVNFQRFRHWLLLLFGSTGLGLIYIKANVNITNKQLLFILPPSFLTTGFILTLISGLALEIGYILITVNPNTLTETIRFWAGRFSEIGELDVAIVAFSYACHKFNSLSSKVISKNLDG